MKWSDIDPRLHRIPDDPEERAELADAIDDAATRTPSQLSDDERQRVRTMRAEGIPRLAVAKAFGITRRHVSAIVSKGKVRHEQADLIEVPA